MSVPLFLLNLPFLLLFLLVLCGRKKKKSNEETPQAPVKMSTTSKSNELEKEAPPVVEKPIKEEETQETSEEREIRQAQQIIRIRKAFETGPIITEEMKEEAWKCGAFMPNFHEGCYRNRIRSDVTSANRVYKKHKCTHPEKSKAEDEKCTVCTAYIEYIAMLYEHYNYYFRYETFDTIYGDLSEYGGKLPSFLENYEWLERKEQLKKEMEAKMKGDPPAGTFEERDAKLTAESKQIVEIVEHVDYWNSPDEEFRQRIAKDYEETRKIYLKHDCRGIPPRKGAKKYGCFICFHHMGETWARRLYKELLENKKRFPEGIKEQLEEDFFLHQQKFGWQLPKFLEHPTWTTKHFDEWRAKEEKKKKQKKP